MSQQKLCHPLHVDRSIVPLYAVLWVEIGFRLRCCWAVTVTYRAEHVQRAKKRLPRAQKCTERAAGTQHAVLSTCTFT